jgi:hypothetical protein
MRAPWADSDPTASAFRAGSDRLNSAIGTKGKCRTTVAKVSFVPQADIHRALLRPREGAEERFAVVRTANLS